MGWLKKYQAGGTVMNKKQFKEGGNVKKKPDTRSPEQKYKDNIDQLNSISSNPAELRRIQELKNRGLMAETAPRRSVLNKAGAIARNPLTAAQYILQGKEIPDYLERGETNSYDRALDVFNPLTYYDAGKRVVTGEHFKNINNAEDFVDAAGLTALDASMAFGAGKGLLKKLPTEIKNPLGNRQIINEAEYTKLREMQNSPEGKAAIRKFGPLKARNLSSKHNAYWQQHDVQLEKMWESVPREPIRIPQIVPKSYQRVTGKKYTGMVNGKSEINPLLVEPKGNIVNSVEFENAVKEASLNKVNTSTHNSQHIWDQRIVDPFLGYDLQEINNSRYIPGINTTQQQQYMPTREVNSNFTPLYQEENTPTVTTKSTTKSKSQKTKKQETPIQDTVTIQTQPVDKKRKYQYIKVDEKGRRESTPSYDNTKPEWYEPKTIKYQNGGNTSKQSTNLWGTDRTAWMDSVMNANANKDWVQQMYNPKAKTLDIDGVPRQQFLEYGEGAGKQWIYPTINRVNGVPTYFGNNAGYYAAQKQLAIPVKTPEQADYFIQNSDRLSNSFPEDIARQRFPDSYKEQGGTIGNYWNELAKAKYGQNMLNMTDEQIAMVRNTNGATDDPLMIPGSRMIKAKDGKKLQSGVAEMQGGGVAPYITHDPNDPRIHSYKDSTDLYNLYKLQERIHGNSQNIPASYFLNMSPFWATQMGEENRNLRRKARPDENPRFNAWSMALGNNPITNRELENYERRSRLPFDPRGIVDKGDQEIINAAKGLNNPNVYTANRQSPDIYHPSIKPMGYYIETPRNGQAKGSVNYIYKNPEQEVIYEPPATSKTVIKAPSKKVTKVISVDPVNPINVIQIPEKKTKYQFIKKDSHGVRESPIMDERVEPEWYATPKYKQGGMIKRADGSYSQRGLWDNIRANAGSGKQPTKEMLKQEKKIRGAEKKEYGGWLDQYQSGGTIAKDGKLLAPSSPSPYPDMDPAMLQGYRQMQRQMEMLSTPEGRRVLAGEAYQKNRKQKANQAKIEDKETLQRMKDKAAQQRAESDPSIFNPSFWKEDPMSGRTATQRLEDMGTDLQTRVFQTGNKTYDSYLNTPGYIAHMAGNLAKAPAEAQRQNSLMPYVSAIGEPLLLGAGETIAEPYVKKAVEKLAPYYTKAINLLKPSAKKSYSNAEYAKKLLNDIKNKSDIKYQQKPVRTSEEKIYHTLDQNENTIANDFYNSEQTELNTLKAENQRFGITSNELEKLKIKHKPEFEQLYGKNYMDKDLGLFAKMKNINEIARLETERKSFLKKMDEAFILKHRIKENNTPEEELLIDIYTKGYDKILNKRKGSFPEGKVSKFYNEEVIPKLEELIKQNKLQDEQILTRGDYDYLVENVWDAKGNKLPPTKYSELQVGYEWEPNSFLSTSIDKNIGFGTSNLKSEIIAPKGQSVLYPNASGVKNFDTELEVLLPEKLRYKVEKRRQDLPEWEKMPDGHTLNEYSLDGTIQKKYVKNNGALDIYDNTGKLITKYDDLDIANIEILSANEKNNPKFTHKITNPYVLAPFILGTGAFANSQKESKKYGGKLTNNWLQKY
jgi:hypothetical protein